MLWSGGRAAAGVDAGDVNGAIVTPGATLSGMKVRLVVLEAVQRFNHGGACDTAQVRNLAGTADSSHTGQPVAPESNEPTADTARAGNVPLAHRRPPAGWERPAHAPGIAAADRGTSRRRARERRRPGRERLALIAPERPSAHRARQAGLPGAPGTPGQRSNLAMPDYCACTGTPVRSPRHRTRARASSRAKTAARFRVAARAPSRESNSAAERANERATRSG